MTKLELANKLINASKFGYDGPVTVNLVLPLAEYIVRKEMGASPFKFRRTAWMCGTCETAMPSHAFSHYCGQCGTKSNWTKE